jgi:hypothetical protein
MLILFSMLAAAVLFVAIVLIGPLITRRFSIRANFAIIGVYLAILIALSAACALISPSALKTPAGADMAEGPPPLGQELLSDIGRGDFDAPDGFTKFENSFDVTGDSISISAHIYGAVYVGTKGKDAPDNGNGKIDVYSYAAGTVRINGTNYVEPMESPDYTYQNSAGPALEITQKEEKKQVDLYRFDDAALIRQLSGDSVSTGSGSSSASLAVVVLLPPGVSYTGNGTEPFSALRFGA